jgi:hypothetical protein
MKSPKATFTYQGSYRSELASDAAIASSPHWATVGRAMELGQIARSSFALVPGGNLKSANSATRANWSYRQATTVRHPHYLPRVDGIVYGGMIGTRRLCIAYCSSTLYIRLLRSVRESAATFAVSATDQVVGEGDQGGVLVEKLMGKNRGFALAGAFEAFTYQIEIWEARATSMPDSMWGNWISSRWTRRSATRALTWRTSR